MPPARILLIEDDVPIRRFLRAALPAELYALEEADTGQQGLRTAATSPPDVVLLDLGLPDVEGLEVLKRLREWSSVPVIVLSARGQERDKVAALDAGADDYLTKPFGVEELLARIRVALRHRSSASAPQAVLQCEDLKLDQEARRVYRGSREIHLTPIEYKLLSLLMRNAGKVVTHRQILKEVWGPHDIHETHYLRVFMATLRRKIEDEPARPRFLLTETGVGYRFHDI
jgi:two-component system KDP operon response regulator KdpE